MFTKLAKDIEFSDVETFCREWGEGVRVEYKRKITAIGKVVSSFANTLGGIFIIGAETDKTTNKVKFPIQGIPNEAGIEERITQCALTGIYPGVTPEVITRDVPGENGNVIVIVRVDGSLQAPHAIQNSTKVYIRTGSISQPHELAEIDRIEYLIKRREAPQRIAQQIIDRIEERARYSTRLQDPHLTFVTCPVFPYQQLMSPPEIYEYIENQDKNPKSHIVLKKWDIDFGSREVTGGVCFMGIPGSLLYWELNEHGIIYNREGLSRQQDSAGEEDCLLLNDIVRDVSHGLTTARDFYQECQYLGNIEITAKLHQVKNERLMIEQNHHRQVISYVPAVDPDCTASVQCLALDLLDAEMSTSVTVRLIGQLLWGLNVFEGWRQEQPIRDIVEQFQD